MSPISPAPSGCSRPAPPSIRNSRPTTPIPSPRSSNWPASAGDWEFQRLHGMGEALYERGRRRPSSWTGRAGSTRRSAATRICSPIWCGGCSKTAPTPRSSTASSTRGSRSTRSSPTRSRALARLPAKPHPRIPLPRDLYGPERRNSRGLDLDRSARPRRAAARGLPQALRRPWRAGADRSAASSRPARASRSSTRATAAAGSATVVDGRRRRRRPGARPRRRAPRRLGPHGRRERAPSAGARRRSLRAATAPS